MEQEVGGSNLSAVNGLIFRISHVRGPAARAPTGYLLRRGRLQADMAQLTAVQKVEPDLEYGR